MTKRYFLLLVLVVLTLSSVAIYAQDSHDAAATKPAKPGGYVLERDKEVAKNEPGTHNGGGETVGYSFFSKTPNLSLVFRKRAFKPGSAIGYHLQHEDEIYYVLSGRGMMTIDGKEFEVGPGDCRSDAARQLPRSQADRQRGSRDPDQLRTGSETVTSRSRSSRARSAFVKSAISLSVPPLARRPAAS